MSTHYKMLENNIKAISESSKLNWGDYDTSLTNIGYCYGLTHMWGKAVLAEDTATFFNRLALLTRDYQQNPYTIQGEQFNDITHVLAKAIEDYQALWKKSNSVSHNGANNNNGSDNDNDNNHHAAPSDSHVKAAGWDGTEFKLFLSIRAFLDGLLIYHQPGNTALYHDQVSLTDTCHIVNSNSETLPNCVPAEQDAARSSKFICFENTQLTRVYAKPFVIDSGHYDSIFTAIAKASLLFSQDRIAHYISIDGKNHTIGLITRPDQTELNQHLIIFDTNRVLDGMSTQPLVEPAAYNMTEGVKALFTSFAHGNSDDNTSSQTAAFSVSVSVYTIQHAPQKRIFEPLLRCDDHANHQSHNYDTWLNHIKSSGKYQSSDFLHIICKYGYSDILKSWLDQKNIDLNQYTYGITPLIIAIYYEHQELVRCLTDHQVDVNKPEEGNGVSPLITAVKTRQEDIFNLLLEKGADINARDDKRRTALHWACDKGELNIVKQILATAHFNKAILYYPPYEEEEYPINIALDKGHREIFNFLKALMGTLAYKKNKVDLTNYDLS